MGIRGDVAMRSTATRTCAYAREARAFGTTRSSNPSRLALTNPRPTNLRTLSRSGAQHAGEDPKLDGRGDGKPTRKRGSGTHTKCGRLEPREAFCKAPEGRGSRGDTTNGSRDLEVLLVRPV